ncbi:unannotated protein [freshwater metagenome]|uniref:Unannotated protein n=1 Tax=freshwater metagenome TaxID=449393 RepID=A0A6J6CWU4_9ZZZZ
MEYELTSTSLEVAVTPDLVIWLSHGSMAVAAFGESVRVVVTMAMAEARASSALADPFFDLSLCFMSPPTIRSNEHS